MFGTLLRWGVPGLVTVVGGTALAIAMTGQNVAADLNSRTVNVLTGDHHKWARVVFDGRDARIAGTATDQRDIDLVIAEVRNLHGVRSVQSDIVLAEFVSPFPFRATVNDGQVAVTGGVPDETAHAEILLTTGASDDQLRLMSGVPDRTEWKAAVRYGLDYLTHFDSGEIWLEDLTMGIAGRAKSDEAFAALRAMDQSGLPAGVSLAELRIEPPLASPFEWKATFDGKAIVITGFSPTEEFSRQLENTAAMPVSAELKLASGAPENFEKTASLLLENLVRMESGEATISGDVVTFKGAPSDSGISEAVRLALTPMVKDLDLAPPRVLRYSFTATRAGGETVLRGFVPDQAMLDRLEALDGVDASALTLGRGEPEGFVSAIDFGFELLSQMEDGVFALSGSNLSIEGHAATVPDLDSLERVLNQGPPDGLVLARSAIKPPLAEPFTWTATKSDDGKLDINGFVPTREARQAIRTAAGEGAEDTAVLADGAPADFEHVTVAALKILPLLQSGSVAYDGTRWSFAGLASTPQSAFQIENAFEAAGLEDAGWTFDVRLPAAPQKAALPIIDPYVWRAQKGSDGRITFGGFVPTEGLKSVLLGRAGANVVDNSALGAGVPENFVGGALAGLDALMALDEGSLGFADGKWSLIGRTANGSNRTLIETALAAATDTAGWDVAIQAQDAAPVVSPYLWSATKTADGSVSFGGYVTSDELKRSITERAGAVARDTTEIASGEPAGFADDVLAGLDALEQLVEGTVKLEGGRWTLVGTPATTEAGDAAIAALTAGTGAGAGWTATLATPVPADVAVVEPTPSTETDPATPATPDRTIESDVAVDPATPAEPTDPATDVAVVTEPVAEPTTPVVPTTEPTLTDPSEPVADPVLDVAKIEPKTPAVESEAVAVVRDFAFVASKPLDGAVELEGKVPAEPAQRFIGVVAGNVPTDKLVVAEGLPSDFIPNADAGIRALTMLDAGEFGLAGDQWVLSGRVETEAERAAVLQSLAAINGADRWETEITMLPPIDVCKRKVGAFASRNAIVFQSGSAQLAEASRPALDELAMYLSSCPEAVVYVEGHTDADGDEELNLALSVARAESVVNSLIDHGIGFERLYAVGYGESLPIASNDTTAGKQANRRIAFTFTDESQPQQ